VKAACDKPTAVYRIFDAAGQLLYVGLTADPDQRFRTHSRMTPWWSEVAATELHWFATHMAAWDSEKRAIDEEGPRYNGSGRGDGRPPTGQTPARNFRIADAVWNAAAAIAAQRGETMPAVVAQALQRYVVRHRGRTGAGDANDHAR